MILDAFVVFLMVSAWLAVVLGALWAITKLLGMLLALAEGEPVTYTSRKQRAARAKRRGQGGVGTPAHQ